MRTESWGRLSTGAAVALTVLESPSGVAARVAPFGAALVSLEVPDRAGRPGEVVLGLSTPAEYEENPNYLGVTVGRFAGRIAGGRLPLDGHETALPRNFLGHHLHGGSPGFGHRLWSTDGSGSGAGGSPAADAAEAEWVRYGLVSADGDQGYPGTVRASVTYALDAEGSLAIRFEARTDAPTHVNLTNHAYFNLAGSGGVDGHSLSIAARRYLVLGEAGIPTGELAPVEGTAYDFRGAKPLFRDAPAYDHCFALDAWDGALRECAVLSDPASGRVMTVRTTTPGVQLYTPDFRDPIHGRGGIEHRGRAAVCLETQFFPDTPNQPAFPPTRLDPGQVWRHETVLSFGTR